MSSGLKHALTYIGRIFNFRSYTLPNAFDWTSLWVAFAFSAIVLVVDIIQELKPQTSIFEKLDKWHIAIRWTIYIAFVFIVLMFGYYGKGLPVFQFGYVQY